MYKRAYHLLYIRPHQGWSDLSSVCVIRGKKINRLFNYLVDSSAISRSRPADISSRVLIISVVYNTGFNDHAKMSATGRVFDSGVQRG
ncbi:hypothetical protein AQUCO_01700231v1 [Aquilegia coerulea]|uniref:Uncharacterized protein n=1 Tax=Aquilegia coerulea TaxID=218851 RepID=A0A2G5DLX5_AQUCA|nr:hypothetical protein AQUCO_01700231v1 [Aquilegia coerulea]